MRQPTVAGCDHEWAEQKRRLERDLRNCRGRSRLQVDDDYAFVVVSGLKLPPGYNCSSTDATPRTACGLSNEPTGVGGSHVYLPPALRFHGRRLDDLHEDCQPTFCPPRARRWACSVTNTWIGRPHRDDLIKFVEMVRADLTKPKPVGIYLGEKDCENNKPE